MKLSTNRINFAGFLRGSFGRFAVILVSILCIFLVLSPSGNTAQTDYFNIAAAGVVDETDDSSTFDEDAMKTSTVVRMLGRGFAITLMVAIMSLLTGFILALPMGLILNNPRIPGYIILRSFNDFIRGTPVLIQLFFVYFGLGALHFSLGAREFSLSLTPITAAIVTLAINASAYMAEVVRSGLMSVDRGQLFAGRALGMSRAMVFRYVIWPQAFRIAMPPLMNSVVALLKDTALISVISVGEVIREAQSIISVTFNPMKYYFIVAVMFFVVTYPLMKYASYVEEKIKQKGFAHD